MTQAVIAQPQIHHIGQQNGDQRVPPGDGQRGGLLRRVARQPAAQQPQQRAGRQKRRLSRVNGPQPVIACLPAMKAELRSG